jgi:hypothetical protein
MKALPLLALVLACGAAQGGGASQALTAHDLYPMEMGAVWSFDLDTGIGPPVLGVMRVENVDGMQVTIRNNGDQVSTYERRPEGIFHLESDSWLLRDPIVVGEGWPSAGGRQAQIQSIEATASTPAGDFTGCVDVEETGGEDGRVIHTIYCLGHGMVEQRASMTMEMTGSEAAVNVKLRGYMVTEEY